MMKSICINAFYSKSDSYDLTVKGSKEQYTFIFVCVINKEQLQLKILAYE